VLKQQGLWIVVRPSMQIMCVVESITGGTNFISEQY
jgi:hypothetical protein